LTQPGLRIEISGHTDSLGPQAINLTLSEKRATAVKNYLIAHGVASDRLRAEGYGEFNPIATNETEEGRAKNRRVEFKVLNRGTAK
jgi:outer membrane protein OmpA-like peptidoglycan-associated protein